MVGRVLAIVLSVVVTVSAVSSPGSSKTEIPALPALKCLYRILKPKAAVQSIDVYIVDDFRSAIEFKFRTNDGREMTSYVVFMADEDGTSYDGVGFRNASDDVYYKEKQFISSIENGLRHLCHIPAIGDLVIPAPRARDRWRWVDLSEEK